MVRDKDTLMKEECNKINTFLKSAGEQLMIGWLFSIIIFGSNVLCYPSSVLWLILLSHTCQFLAPSHPQFCMSSACAFSIILPSSKIWWRLFLSKCPNCLIVFLSFHQKWKFSNVLLSGYNHCYFLCAPCFWCAIFSSHFRGFYLVTQVTDNCASFHFWCTMHVTNIFWTYNLHARA